MLFCPRLVIDGDQVREFVACWRAGYSVQGLAPPKKG
jgi:hypothetical protein